MVATGLNTIIGTGVESTYGTPVAVDRFYEFTSESIGRNNNILQSNGIRAGARNLRRGAKRSLSTHDASGSIEMEVATKGFSRWFQHILGSTPTVVQQGATPAYLHTHALASTQGKSLTILKSLRQGDSTEVETFRYHGCKITSAEFSISAGEILTLSIDVDAEDEDTVTAMPTATFLDAPVFHFKQGVLKVDGSSVAAVTSASVSVENPMQTDRYYLGSAGLKAEPRENDFPAVSGSLSAEFLSPTVFYDRFVADSAAALILEFEGATISGAYKETLRITVPEVHFTGETPKVGGPDIVALDVPYEAAAVGSTAGTTIEYISTDTAV